MKCFSAISLCVLATLALSVKGAFVVHRPTVVGVAKTPAEYEILPTTSDGDAATIAEIPDEVRFALIHPIEHFGKNIRTHPKHKTKSGTTSTTERCCQIGDIGMLMPIIMNGTGPLRRKAIGMMIENAKQCIEKDTTNGLRTNSRYMSSSEASIELRCNIVDFVEFFPKLIHGTKDQKAQAFNAIDQSAKLCNAKKRAVARGKFPVCELEPKKWGLLTQWIFGQYLNKAAKHIKNVIHQLRILTSPRY